MNNAPQHVAALLGSRICHDLVSPIGAISNGIELLQMSGGPSSPELDLIFESVENANARIKFFRIAFGLATMDQQIGANEIRDILRDLTKGTRLSINWHPSDDLPRDQVKIVFLLLQCFETAMPWGGQVAVSRDNGSWKITGRSERMKIDQALWDLLLTGVPSGEVAAAQVQFMLLPTLLLEGRHSLRLDLGDTEINAEF